MKGSATHWSPAVSKRRVQRNCLS
uniref:Uncharacterized protein n=1 Tax=Anguilla anguilla TaxID=7936 RepID=A0A0E9W2I1_ANGAN